MTAPTYSFQRQLAQGEEGEKFLDEFFSPDFHIQRATREEQRQGIDRRFSHKRTGRKWAVEYKTDARAGQTGNAFVETESVSAGHKAGWALSSRADFLVYFVPEPATIYLLPMAAVRRKLQDWAARYPSRQVANVGYVTTGLLVPLHEFERIAAEVF
jgi:hypothetical protein